MYFKRSGKQRSVGFSAVLAFLFNERDNIVDTGELVVQLDTRFSTIEFCVSRRADVDETHERFLFEFLYFGCFR